MSEEDKREIAFLVQRLLSEGNLKHSDYSKYKDYFELHPDLYMFSRNTILPTEKLKLIGEEVKVR